MKSDNTQKTAKFIKNGVKLWLILILVFLALQEATQNYGDVPIPDSSSGYFLSISMVIFIYHICGIPFILILSVVLLYAEKLIDKIHRKLNE